MNSVFVQLEFMEKMVEEGALQYFLEARISYESLEKMFNTIWEQKGTSLSGLHEAREEILAREELLRLINAIDEEELEEEAFHDAGQIEWEYPDIGK